MYLFAYRVQETLQELIQSQPRDLWQHSHSVACIAADLSQTACRTSKEQERVWIGSLLHDIGKQFVPASILEKKGSLSPAEFSCIQQHPWVGYIYLNNFVSDSIILNTVLYHHERWDGTGYPCRLKGEQIPLGARICALADVWDALVSDRCYRSAWSMSQAVNLIWAGAGSQFDPWLAFQFLAMIEGQEKYASIADAQDTPTFTLPGRNAPAFERKRLAGLRGSLPA